MPTVLSSYDLLKGRKGKWDKYTTLVSPIQMISKNEKDDDWKEGNLDWLEHIGMMQVRQKARPMLKMYNMAEGIIDKEDYIPGVDNEYGKMIDTLTKENESPLEIRFYPIIPNVINVLTGEFSKRNSKVIVKAVDEYSVNDMLTAKKEKITEVVLQRAQSRIIQKMAEQGIQPTDEQMQQAMQQVQSLPEIQEFFNKTYKGIAEQWANHELSVAERRFNLFELENIGFRDSLITDEELWHVRLTDNDYQVELWNPVYSFYHRSPDVRYVSEGNYAGRFNLMSISDVIDTYGYLMTKDQLKSLERIITPRSDYGRLQGSDATPTDFYNNTKGPDDQIKSVHWNQAVGMKSLFDNNALGFFDWLYNDDSLFNNSMIRVMEVYWKSQKQIGYLKQIDERGNVFEDTVSEDFIVTLSPVYDDTIDTSKTKDNLIFGQHIDWLWVNEVWKGIKIGCNLTNGFLSSNNDFEPIYLDVRPLEFQFKGETNVYGCKLPVEGCTFSDRNAKKSSFVKRMSPWQVGFNLVNNQLVDLTVDEVGNVILFDQNMIPRNSMDGSWGKHNFMKAYEVMKNFGFLPVDTTIANTEGQLNWNHTTQVSLEKTNMIASRIKLGEYFKNEAFSVVGISPQRLGGVAASESATGVQQAVNNSYTQTESMFIKHSDFLMPRVKQMILNAAQYVDSTKENVRKTYMNANEENVFFEMEGTRLLLADFDIYPMSKSNQRDLLEQLKQLAVQNNTTNATIFDLAKIIESDSVAEIMATLKTSVDNMQQQQQSQQQAQMQAQQQKDQAQTEREQAARDFQADQNELDRANERFLAEVKALGYAKDQDIDSNNIPDPLEVARFNHEQGVHSEDILFKQQQENNKRNKEQQDFQIKQKEIALKQTELKEKAKQAAEDRKVERENMKNDLTIAKQNRINRSTKK